VIRKLEVTLADGTKQWARLPDGVSAEDALWALLDGSWASVTRSRDDWIELHDGRWARLEAVVACAMRDEEQMSLVEVMALSPDEQEEYFSRHPLPDIHQRAEGPNGPR
jgi:hypothetical protein